MKEPQLPISPPAQLQRPPPPHQEQRTRTGPRFITLGAGSRGTAYAQAVTTTTNGSIHAVADPHAFRRREFGRRFIWGDSHDKAAPGQEFSDWREWVAYEVNRRQNGTGEGVGVHGVFICTLDHTHVEIVLSIARYFPDLHILCEKPLALSLADCLSVYRALTTTTTGSDNSSSQETKAIFSIGHVLRYSPHNNILRRVVLHDRAIGDIVSLEHTEPVGWWHFSHSYVRGNWRRETANGDGSLLTKSCHDIDFIMWLLASGHGTGTGTGPGTGSGTETEAEAEAGTGSRAQTGPRPVVTHHPRTITSTGSLTQFTRSNKPTPAAQSSSTNCLSCPSEPSCLYSARKIYLDAHLSHSNRDWPVDVVVPDIEDVYLQSGPRAAESYLLDALREDYTPDTPDSKVAARPWYGRCVYDADNSVCDDQVVTITWDDSTISSPSPCTGQGYGLKPKTAIFHMIAPTEKQCQRRGIIYGTTGEIHYDSDTITTHKFTSNATGIQTHTSRIEVPPTPPDQPESHGGGDYGLARSFVGAVDAVVNRGWGVRDAQVSFLGCTLEEVVRSHAVVFAAEEARRDEVVVKWREWWTRQLATVGMVP